MCGDGKWKYSDDCDIIYSKTCSRKHTIQPPPLLFLNHYLDIFKLIFGILAFKYLKTLISKLDNDINKKI